LRAALLLCAASLFWVSAARAQFYSTGIEPASLRWRQLKTPDLRVVFPEGSEGIAARALKYMDTVRHYVSFGYTYGTMRTPLVLHTRNFLSNGLVMWAPKRIEFVAAPESDTYSEPWLKQLATHEYRHNVQYNNQNRGWTKAFSYILGQQSPLVAQILLPIWYLEGDAVLCETQLSTYGRGLQPSFNINYRMLNDCGRFFGGGTGSGAKPYPFDKWFCGSFKDYIPDHYALGYQLVSWTDYHYGNDFWDRIIRFSTRNTWMIFTKNIAMRRYYNTKVRKIFNEAFTDLGHYWDSLPRVENSAAVVPNLPVTSYTTYTSPVLLSGGDVLAIKSDLDRPFRIVRVDPQSGKEEVIAHTGVPSSRLSERDGEVYWTEYRQSTLWDQKVNSQLCRLDLHSGRVRLVRGERQTLYPVAMKDGYAVVEYNYDGTYSIKYGARHLDLPDTISVHGLAYDDLMQRFYFIGLSDGGMWLGSADTTLSGFEAINRPAHITVANLNASGGRLYFNSIASGKDEAHMFDIASRTEYRISTSTYGSVAPATLDGRHIVMTTFGPQGYLLSAQTVGNLDTLERVDPAPVPCNVVNPPRGEWNIFNIDTVKVDSSLPVPSKNYHAGLRLFNFHSWAPAWYDPSTALSGTLPTVHAGVTLISQNLLNSVVSTFGYGYTRYGSMWTGRMDYLGLPVKFSLAVQYGGGDQNISSLSNQAAQVSVKPYLGAGVSAYVPVSLSSGYHSRTLTPIVSYTYDNSLVINPDNTPGREGSGSMTASLQYSDNLRPAYKDFLPRLGYQVRLSTTFAPGDDRYSNLYSAFARVFLPGVALHHSVRLRATSQFQTTDASTLFVFSQQELVPWGTPSGLHMRRYSAAAADYQLPVWYPDGGWSSVIYFRRLRINAGGCYGEYQDFGSRQVPSRWHSLYSYGGDLLVDFAPFRFIAAINLTLTLSAYYSGYGMQYGWNLNIPF